MKELLLEDLKGCYVHTSKRDDAQLENTPNVLKTTQQNMYC